MPSTVTSGSPSAMKPRSSGDSIVIVEKSRAFNRIVALLLLHRRTGITCSCFSQATAKLKMSGCEATCPSNLLQKLLKSVSPPSPAPGNRMKLSSTAWNTRRMISRRSSRPDSSNSTPATDMSTKLNIERRTSTATAAGVAVTENQNFPILSDKKSTGSLLGAIKGNHRQPVAVRQQLSALSQPPGSKGQMGEKRLVVYMLHCELAAASRR
jgi:hypothetical protein